MGAGEPFVFVLVGAAVGASLYFYFVWYVYCSGYVLFFVAVEAESFVECFVCGSALGAESFHVLVFYVLASLMFWRCSRDSVAYVFHGLVGYCFWLDCFVEA